MRYEIDENNAITMWQDGADTPFIYQPDYPDTTPFTDRADAEAWAQAKIAELSDIEAPYAPNYPGELPQKQQRKIDAEAAAIKKSAAEKLAALGLTAQEVRALLG